MSEIILGLGDFAASRTPGDVIKTFALGSCVAVIFYDPLIKAAGMIHVVLPDASLVPGKVPEKPGYFADTGEGASETSRVPRLFEWQPPCHNSIPASEPCW